MTWPLSVLKVGDGYAFAPFPVVGRFVASDQGVICQELAHGPSQRARALAVDDAGLGQPGAHRLIQVAIQSLHKSIDHVACPMGARVIISL